MFGLKITGHVFAIISQCCTSITPGHGRDGLVTRGCHYSKDFGTFLSSIFKKEELVVHVPLGGRVTVKDTCAEDY